MSIANPISVSIQLEIETVFKQICFILRKIKTMHKGEYDGKIYHFWI